MRVFVESGNIISALGFNTNQNFYNVYSGISGINEINKRNIKFGSKSIKRKYRIYFIYNKRR